MVAYTLYVVKYYININLFFIGYDNDEYGYVNTSVLAGGSQ